MDLTTDKSDEIEFRIKKKIPDAQIEVINSGERHYSLIVVSNVFEGLTQVKQHQLVYSAITDLLSGDNAPIHAIDRMDIRTETDISLD